ncbi:MAG: flippase-like domain-containing protein [Lachnospiraceae bacterium]|nr:flippase-like domain-containing protein [Lachnospiraceae bacterium]
MQTWILMIIGFILVHLFKMIRLYLVLMEHKLPFWDFVLLYLRTTFVNLLIPFKLGEVYRIEEISRLTGIWQVGVLSVVVDRYYDILALFLWLLAIGIWQGGVFCVIFPVFGVLILLGALLYLAIPGSFSYLNRYLIRRGRSGRSLAALRGLDLVKIWYDFTAKLIEGRAFLIIATSALGWGAELITLFCLGRSCGLMFRVSDFGNYIDSIFLRGGNMPIYHLYTGRSTAALLAATLGGYLILGIAKVLNQPKKDEEK